MILHACKNPATGGPVNLLYQGKTVKDEETWFCPVCKLRLERVEDKFYIDPIEHRVYAAEEERLKKLNEPKKRRKR